VELAAAPEQGQRVRCVSWSPDGQRIVAGYDDGRIRVWDAGLTELLLTAEGHTDPVWGVQWSPDGGVFASGSDDRTARVWDAGTGECLAVQPGHGGRVRSVAFSSDGTRLVTASDDGTVGIWDVADLTAPGDRPSAPADPLAVYVARQAEMVGRAGAGPAATEPVWVPRLDGADGPCLGVLRAGEHNQAGAVALSPDGRSLFTGDSDGSLRRWDLATGREAWVLAEVHSGTVYDVALSHDGSRLAAGSNGGGVSVWDADSGSVLWRAREHTVPLTHSIRFRRSARNHGRILPSAFPPGGPARRPSGVGGSPRPDCCPRMVWWPSPDAHRGPVGRFRADRDLGTSARPPPVVVLSPADRRRPDRNPGSGSARGLGPRLLVVSEHLPQCRGAFDRDEDACLLRERVALEVLRPGLPASLPVGDIVGEEPRARRIGRGELDLDPHGPTEEASLVGVARLGGEEQRVVHRPRAGSIGDGRDGRVAAVAYAGQARTELVGGVGGDRELGVL